MNTLGYHKQRVALVLFFSLKVNLFCFSLCFSFPLFTIFSLLWSTWWTQKKKRFKGRKIKIVFYSSKFWPKFLASPVWMKLTYSGQQEAFCSHMEGAIHTSLLWYSHYLHYIIRIRIIIINNVESHL